MRSTTATAPGKVILFGEHAVVYGRPAIAVPVTNVKATATLTDAPAGAGCSIEAPDINAHVRLAANPSDPLALAVRLAIQESEISSEPDWHLAVTSDIPIAGGLGSGAAVSAALVKAVLAHSARSRSPQPDLEIVNRIVFAVEKLHHANPSGIDNTVVVYQQPVWYLRGQTPEQFEIVKPFQLVIADSGVASSTAAVVSDVRQAWRRDTSRYDQIFDGIGAIAEEARQTISAGRADSLGELMQENQRLLRLLDVSSAELERLIAVAEESGAAGAKLSGAGRGGNLIAVAASENVVEVREALLAAGAAGVLVAQVDSYP